VKKVTPKTTNAPVKSSVTHALAETEPGKA